MPSSEIEKTSASPASTTEAVIRKWLVVFGSLFGRDMSELLIASWCELLSDLVPEVVEQACRRAAETCKFFPTPADVRVQIDRAEELDLESEAEDAWQGLLDSIAENYIPDIGRSPPLAWDVEHAARAAGGLHYLESCPNSELVWARKRFIEDFLRIRKTGDANHLLLCQRGFHRLLAQVSEVSSKAAKPLAAAPEVALPPRRETEKAERTVADKIIRPMPAPPSEEEIARRKVDQKHRLEDWLRTRPQAASAEVSKG